MGSDTAVGFDALIASIPSGSDASARTTVIAAHPCRNLHQMDTQERERAGMATVAIAYRCECKADSRIKPRMRLRTGGIDFRIYAVVARKRTTAPLYYVLHLEDEGVTYG
jgi:hypothetical protein